MSSDSRFSAAAAYLPIIGWLYVYVFRRRDALAMFHLRQAVGLVLWLIGVVVAWAVAAWVLAWLPYMGALGMGLFSLVMVAFFFGILAVILGVLNALRRRAVPLPICGRWASRLPIR